MLARAAVFRDGTLVGRSGRLAGASHWVAVSYFIRSQKEADELRFEVNGQMFFVNFVPEEGRWFCYAPTATGMQKIPVSMDAAPFENFSVSMDELAKEVVN